jgi:cytochrome c oxidase subunit 1
MWAGKKVGRNPWDSTTLEWDAPSPPGHGNFDKPLTVYRGPYEYSVPGADKDFSPQTEAPKSEKPVPAPAH